MSAAARRLTARERLAISALALLASVAPVAAVGARLQLRGVRTETRRTQGNGAEAGTAEP